MSDWRSRSKVNGDVVFFNYYEESFSHVSGEVYVWDLDKTYLDTKWHSLSDIIQSAFEKPYQKRNVPGSSALVKALMEHVKLKRSLDRLPIFFITASPPQIEEQIREKLKFDHIDPLGIFCKDNLKNLKPKRWRRLTQQIGYKLQSLLQLRTLLGQDVSQVFWGDDSESDAVIYSLYSDVCSRRYDQQEMQSILNHFQVTDVQVDTIFQLQEQIPVSDPVEKVYINLAVDTDSEYYLQFGRRTVPTRNYYQVALDLFQDGRLSKEHVIKVGMDLKDNYNFSRDELEVSLDDMVRRQILSSQTLQNILPEILSAGLIAPDYKPSVAPLDTKSEIGERVFELEGMHEPWVPEKIDYFHNYR